MTQLLTCFYCTTTMLRLPLIQHNENITSTTYKFSDNALWMLPLLRNIFFTRIFVNFTQITYFLTVPVPPLR